ncbi:hypothetical protein [Qipengyuania spongiae]|uniref:Uncharacterized protein n=1 Tax=Qipengyuania spongiae TaxID=2909673 RepID=A0ABY5SYQ3_9SPHN|nr:hypothetical protein [Qipengyuania spongiae]UVI39460.1 hypothetical protein L1F33_00390 [Qipengyuania spongiae]
MSRRQKVRRPFFRTGFVIVGCALLIGYLGVTFWNDALSSSQWLTYGFVGLVVALGLAGAAVVGRAFFVRHNPFRKV